MKKIIIMLSILGSLLLTACASSNEEGATNGEKIQIVSTTTLVTDLIQQIGQDKVQVEGLMGPGIDPHSYQASANDVKKMMNADVVAYNGLHLEAQLGEVFDQLDKQGKEVFVLEEGLTKEDLLSSEDETLMNDPHIWFSVEKWRKSAQYITEKLVEVDSENEAYYRENNAYYQEELNDLADYVLSRSEEIPQETRILITAHDAFHYFGDEFGFEVRGLQGLNTQSEAGTRDVRELAEYIVDKKIKAIFIESSVPTRTIESLQEAVTSQGWDVEIGGELFSDALGDESQNAETYLKMYKQNIDTIIEALD